MTASGVGRSRSMTRISTAAPMRLRPRTSDRPRSHRRSGGTRVSPLAWWRLSERCISLPPPHDLAGYCIAHQPAPTRPGLAVFRRPQEVAGRADMLAKADRVLGGDEGL